MKAIDSKVVIVFMAKAKFSIILLKALLKSYFNAKIGVKGFFKSKSNNKIENP